MGVRMRRSHRHHRLRIISCCTPQPQQRLSSVANGPRGRIQPPMQIKKAHSTARTNRSMRMDGGYSTGHATPRRRMMDDGVVGMCGGRGVSTFVRSAKGEAGGGAPLLHRRTMGGKVTSPQDWRPVKINRWTDRFDRLGPNRVAAARQANSFVPALMEIGFRHTSQSARMTLSSFAFFSFFFCFGLARGRAAGRCLLLDQIARDQITHCLFILSLRSIERPLQIDRMEGMNNGPGPSPLLSVFPTRSPHHI